MKILIVTILTAVILYEAVEHLVFPLVWYFLTRNRRSMSGAGAMVGATVRVKDWHKTSGRVYFKGELWRAVSEAPLEPGHEAVIEGVEGLTLRVKPGGDGGRQPTPPRT